MYPRFPGLLTAVLFCIFCVNPSLSLAEVFVLNDHVLGEHIDPDWNEEMTIRIGVMEKQKKIAVTSEAPLFFSSDGGQIVLEANDTYTFTVKYSVAADLSYYPVVRTIEGHNREELSKAVLKWEALGHKAHLVKAGGKIRYANHLIHDNARHYLVLEPFKTEEECEASLLKLQDDAIHKPWTLELSNTPSKGVMELSDSSGESCGTFSGPVQITSRKAVKVFDVEYGVGYSWHGFQDRHFRGIVEIRIDKTGALQFVSELDIENYLKGVVPSEMSASYPHEALCAQAVAARGETLSKYGTRHLADPYYLCASQHCQVYGGMTKEHTNTSKAVTATSGRILRCGDKIADTVYSACCGGHTESNENVWSTEPSPALRGVVDLKPGAEQFPANPTEAALKKWWSKAADGWCSFSSATYASRYRWKVNFTASEIDDFVKKKYPQVGHVTGLKPLGRGVSGRMTELEITGTNATVVVQKELPIRFLFGVLKSAAFVIDCERDGKGTVKEWTFTGGGWGHGVGMCQWGAKGMANAGRSFRQILSHYFTNTNLLNVYSLKSK